MVTATLTVPAACAGAATVSCVAVLEMIVPLAPPNVDGSDGAEVRPFDDDAAGAGDGSAARTDGADDGRECRR